MFSFFKKSEVQNQPIILGEAADKIEVLIKTSPRAKNIKLRITSKKIVELILPKFANFAIAHKFVLEKENWIRSKLARIEYAPDSSQMPKVISILGEEYAISLNNLGIDLPIKIEGKEILISHSISSKNAPVILSRFLKKLAKIEIEKHTQHICQLLDLNYNRIAIKDTITRWGSCSANKNLSFSWRLILAPRNVMEYVVVHEVCHIIEMNHSSRFWNLVYKFCPDYAIAKIWLKRHGKILHQYF